MAYQYPGACLCFSLFCGGDNLKETPAVACLCKPYPVCCLFCPSLPLHVLWSVLHGYFCEDCDNGNLVVKIVGFPLYMLGTFMTLLVMAVCLFIGIFLDLVVWVAWCVSCGFGTFCCPCRENRWNSKTWCCWLRAGNESSYEACDVADCCSSMWDV